MNAVVVISIGHRAFLYCEKLANVKIPSSVVSIGYGSFDFCGSLTSIEVDENNANYMDDNGVLYFKDKSKIIKCPEGNGMTEYIILDGTKGIEDGAFSYCYDLSKIYIPDTMLEIGYDAFICCEKLTSVEIPSGVTFIGSSAFYGCSNLTRITIDDTNKNYMDDNGVLYTKDGTEIIKYPEGKEGTEYAILSGTIIIGGPAFESNSKLTNIQIPSSVTTIGYGAFYGCDNLTSIEIPCNVTEIGDSTFDRCISLTAINVDENNTNYMDDNGVLYTKDGTKILKYPSNKQRTDYTILSSTNEIGYSVFENCKNLINLTIPRTVTKIEDWIFENCENITIICERGSVAETYAKEKYIKYRIIGETYVLTSTVQKIDEEKLIIRKIKAKTTVGTIKSNLQSEIDFTILDKEGNVAEDAELIGTDYKVRLSDGKEYKIIVWGDFSGDGQISVPELAASSRLAVQSGKIDAKQEMIVDVSMDGNINTTDLAVISRFAAE